MSAKGESPLASPMTGTTARSDETYDPESCQSKRKDSWFSFMRSRTETTQSETVAEKEDPYRTITRTLDQSPEGYSQVATFQSSDRNFLQYRSFGFLHARILLCLQNDIEVLERELDKLDSFDKSPAGDKAKLSCKDADDFENLPEHIDNEEFKVRFKKTRPQILAEIKTKLVEYDEVLLKTKKVMMLQKPSKRDYRSVRDWFVDEGPLIPEEAEFIQRKEDIVTLRSGRECAAFDSWIERVLSRIDDFLIARCGCHVVRRMFMTPELQAKTSNKRLRYYAPAKVDALVNVIITFFIFVLMVLPVVVLYEISDIGQGNPFEAIGVLIIFTLLFGCAMSGLTKASRHELFGASAAYCAVLVVFISNFSTQAVIVEGSDP